jgi:hypothetical protein
MLGGGCTQEMLADIYLSANNSALAYPALVLMAAARYYMNRASAALVDKGVEPITVCTTKALATSWAELWAVCAVGVAHFVSGGERSRPSSSSPPPRHRPRHRPRTLLALRAIPLGQLEVLECGWLNQLLPPPPPPPALLCRGRVLRAPSPFLGGGGSVLPLLRRGAAAGGVRCLGARQRHVA